MAGQVEVEGVEHGVAAILPRLARHYRLGPAFFVMYGDSYLECDFATVERLSALARRKGVSNATLAYAWLLHKGVTAPIVGASKPHQLEEAAAAVELSLPPEEIAELEAGYEPHPVLGHA